MSGGRAPPQWGLKQGGGLGLWGPQWSKKLAGSLGRTQGVRASPGRLCGEVTAEWPGKASGQDWVLLLLAGAGWGTKRPTQLAPTSLPLTKMTTMWGLGRLGGTPSAAIQMNLSKNRNNLSHLTGKVNGSGSLSELAFSCTLHLSALFSSCWLYSQVARPIIGKDAPQPAPGPHPASSVARVGDFLMVPAIVSELTPTGRTWEACPSLKQFLHRTTSVDYMLSFGACNGKAARR